MDLAVKLNIIQKSGSWFSMGEERIGQGKDAAKQFLRDNPELCDHVEEEIRKNIVDLAFRADAMDNMLVERFGCEFSEYSKADAQ